MIGALFPGCRVTDFRRTQQAGTVASIAMFGNDIFRRLGTASAAGGSGNFHAFAFFPWTQTWPTGSRRLAISSVVAAWALTAHRANTVAGAASIFIIRFTRTPSMVASHACGHGLQAGASIAVSPSH